MYEIIRNNAISQLFKSKETLKKQSENTFSIK
jgi:hypothetical protein